MQVLEKYFDTAFDEPNSIKKLRELILTLAMQGKLVPQDSSDQPASELLNEIAKEKIQLVKEGKAKKTQLISPINKNEIPFVVPNNWKWCKLHDISLYIQRGKGPQYVDYSPYKVVSQKCVRWYGLDLQPARCIDPDSLEKYEDIRYLRKNDLLWNSTGTGTIGRACLISTELEEQILVADSHVTVVRPYKTNPNFLFYWIQSPYVQDEIENNASGTTNQIELNTSTVINHMIPLPPLNEQIRIVEKINQLMALCDELEKLKKQKETKKLIVHKSAINQLLDSKDESNSQKGWHFISEHFNDIYTVKENVSELRSAILQLAMQGKLVQQDQSDQPANELLKVLGKDKQPLISKPEQLYAIPNNWIFTNLKNISDINGGYAFKSSQYTKDGIRVIRISDFDDKGIKNDSIIRHSFFDKLNNFKIEENDILMAMTGGTVGKSYFVKTITEPMFTNQRVATIKINKTINQEYIYSVIKSENVQKVIQNAKNSTNDNISMSDISNFIIPLPPLNEQKRIVEKINQLMALCDDLEKQIKNSSSKQTELLNAIMSNLGK